MPQQRQVEPLEQLAGGVLVEQLRQLGRVADQPSGTVHALTLCAELSQRLPGSVLASLADRMLTAVARAQTPLHGAISYLLGGSAARLTLDDAVQLAAVLRGASPAVRPANDGPRRLTVTAASPAWIDSRRHALRQQQQQSQQLLGVVAAALDQVLSMFDHLTHLTLTLCATSDTLASVGRHCRHLFSLRVDVAPVDDAGVCGMLGLPDQLVDSLDRCRHGQRLRPSNLAFLRDLRLESTLVTGRGLILLLEALPQLRNCQISEVDIGEALDWLHGGRLGVDDCDGKTATGGAVTGRQYGLRRLDCRQAMDVGQGERVARCCRQLRRLCLRGRRSIRNDTALLHWFNSMSELSSLELIDMHSSAVTSLLDTIGHQLTYLRLTESFTIGDAGRLSTGQLSTLVGHCPRLQTLSLSLAADLDDGEPTAVPTLSEVRRVGLDGLWGPVVLSWLCRATSHCTSLQLSGHGGGLSDGECLQALLVHPLTQLRRLEMTCSHLSIPAVGALMDACPRLEYIGHLSYPAVEWLRDTARQHNWKLQVT